MNPTDGTAVPSSSASSMDVVQTPTEPLRAAVPATVQPEAPKREIQPAPTQRAQEIFSSQPKPAAQAVKPAPSAPALPHSAMVVDAPASAASSLAGSALEPKRRGRPPKTKTSNSAPAAAPAAVPGAGSSMSQLKPAGALMPPPSERSMPFFDLPSRSTDHPQQHSSSSMSSSKPNGSGGLQRGDRPASFASFTGGLNGLVIASPRESEKERSSSNSASASFAMSSPPAAAAAAGGSSSSSSSAVNSRGRGRGRGKGGRGRGGRSITEGLNKAKSPSNKKREPQQWRTHKVSSCSVIHCSHSLACDCCVCRQARSYSVQPLPLCFPVNASCCRVCIVCSAKCCLEQTQLR
jgi:hypothetical protein